MYIQHRGLPTHPHRRHQFRMDGAVPSAHQLSPLRPLIYHLRPTPAPAHARLTLHGDATARPNFTDWRLGGRYVAICCLVAYLRRRRCIFIPQASSHVNQPSAIAIQLRLQLRSRDADVDIPPLVPSLVVFLQSIPLFLAPIPGLVPIVGKLSSHRYRAMAHFNHTLTPLRTFSDRLRACVRPKPK